MLYFRVLFLLFSLAAQSLLAFAFTNPIKGSNGSDPFMVYHEGYYCAFLSFLSPCKQQEHSHLQKT